MPILGVPIYTVHVRVTSHFPAVYEAAKPRVDRGK